MSLWNKGILRCLEAQNGSISRRQLLGEGLSTAQIQRRLANGSLYAVHRGVYVLNPACISEKQRCTAALLAVGSDAALCGLTAAIVRGWWKRTRLTEVNIMLQKKRRVPGVRIWQNSTFDPGRDIVKFGGLALVRPEFMVAELGSVLTCFQLTNIISEAAYWQSFDVNCFKEVAERWRGRPGIAVARRAVSEYEAGRAGTRSHLEDRFVRLLAFHNLKMPDGAGVPIRSQEVDFVWFDRNLVVEVDGPGHERPNSSCRDPAKDADLRDAGFRVVRFTQAQIVRNPKLVATQVHENLSIQEG